MTSGLPTTDLRSLRPQLNLLNPPPRTIFLGTPLESDRILLRLASQDVVHSQGNSALLLASSHYVPRTRMKPFHIKKTLIKASIWVRNTACYELANVNCEPQLYKFTREILKLYFPLFLSMCKCREFVKKCKWGGCIRIRPYHSKFSVVLSVKRPDQRWDAPSHLFVV